MSKRCFGFCRKKSKSVVDVKPSAPEVSNHLELNRENLPHPQNSESDLDDELENIDNNEFELYERSSFIGTNRYLKSLPTGFDKSRLRYFLGQDVNRIRQTSNSFDDPYFLKCVYSIVENTSSLLFLSLKSRLNAFSDDLDELNGLIKWLRIEEIANKNRNRPETVNPEFVLDEKGRSPSSEMTPLQYSRFFSADDIFQGWLGNCFHIGAMMALTRNENLLDIVVPRDNISVSRSSGVYHFRFWRLGVWYDVCVDDYLATSGATGELIFSRNSFFPNEFWVPLFEKAFAKFMGSYDELEGGLFENSALYLSGGLHEQFHTNIARKLSSLMPDNSSTPKIDADNDEYKNHPNINELFEIIRLALKKTDMVGCILEDDEMALKYGLYKEHFYLISEVFVVEKKPNQPHRFVKIHNPFNTRERIKNSERYVQLEAKLKSYGVPATKGGEFWMLYESFFKCFKRVKVCNLEPEKSFSFDLNPEMEKLKIKTSILNEWKCITYRGSLPANVRRIKWTDADYRKFKVRIGGKEPKNLIFSFIQDWIRRKSSEMELQIIGLRIYTYNSHNEEWTYYKCLWYQESLQWCLRMSLEPGLYLFIYETGYDDLVNDLQYCFRVFYDVEESKKIKNEIRVSVFKENPPFEPDLLE